MWILKVNTVIWWNVDNILKETIWENQEKLHKNSDIIKLIRKDLVWEDLLLTDYIQNLFFT